MAQTWLLKKLVEMDMDGILHFIQRPLKYCLFQWPSWEWLNNSLVLGKPFNATGLPGIHMVTVIMHSLLLDVVVLHPRPEIWPVVHSSSKVGPEGIFHHCGPDARHPDGPLFTPDPQRKKGWPISRRCFGTTSGLNIFTKIKVVIKAWDQNDNFIHFMLVVYMVFFAESTLTGTDRCDVISHTIWKSRTWVIAGG